MQSRSYIFGQRPREQGFTLIELSIALLLIGLLVGGVFVGQELIRAAEVRAQIRQIESFDVAITTFKLKYNDLPGDLRAYEAGSLGFAPRSGASGHGDGNGVVDGCLPYSPDDFLSYREPHYGCENVLLWRDLSDAELIEGRFIDAIDDYITISPATSIADMERYFPKMRLSGTGYIAVQQCMRGAQFILTNIASYSSPFDGYNASSIRNADAYAIDKKIDDGLPRSGRVQPTLQPGLLVGVSNKGYWCHYEDLPPIVDCVTPNGEYNIAADSASVSFTGSGPVEFCFLRIKSQAM